MSNQGYRLNYNLPTMVLTAGPSAHGKTFISQSFAKLLPKAEFLLVDCTSADHPEDILGSGARFHGSETQPGLADFLYRNTGKRCVVVLDEFEKLGRSYGETSDAFLKIFEDGTETMQGASRRDADDCKMLSVACNGKLNSYMTMAALVLQCICCVLLLIL